MERSVDVTTGESVAFRYELAGLGSRFFAVFIDNMIQVAIAVGIVLLLVWLVPTSARIGAPARSTDLLDKVAFAIAVGLISFGIFLLFFGYFILFEWLWEGRTPGKRLLGIRVVRDGGFPLDFTSAVVRNVVRILEVGLGYYIVSAICTLLSPRNRRLGDMAAGTLVVRDLRYERTRIARGRYEGGDNPVTRELTQAERELVRNFAERRSSLTREARIALAARIAASIRPKLGARFDHLSDEDLLVHLAETALA